MVSLAASELRSAKDPTFVLPAAGLLLHFVGMGLDAFTDHQSENDRKQLEKLVRRVISDSTIDYEELQSELAVTHFDANIDRERILARLNLILQAQCTNTDQIAELCQQNLDMWPTFERYLLHHFDRLRKDLGTSLKSIETSLQAIQASAPPLEPRVFQRDHADNILHYQFREVPFVGRQRETAALKSWLDAPDQFSWWKVEAPGGAGKSRLAQELCLHIKDKWHAGFIDPSCSFDFDRWTPSHPTLFVVDYAATLGTEVRDLSRRLDRAASRTTHQLRLLLLDRPASKQLDKSLLSAGDGQAIIENRQYKPDPLKIDPLDDEQLWQVVVSVAHRQDALRQLPDRDTAMDQLKQIDPQRRPLFAAFAGLALARGETIGTWDAKQLTTWVVQRWRDAYWKPAGCHEKEENLLALATLMGGITKQQAQKLAHTPAAEVLPDLNLSATKQNHDAMTGSIHTDRLAPLEPDILGERFILDLLHSGEGSWGQDETQKLLTTLRDAAWIIDPFGFTLFYSRAQRDFPEDPVTLELLNTGSPNPEYPAHHIALLLLYRGIIKGKLGDTDGEIADYDAVVNIADAPAEYKAKALVNRGVNKSQRDDTDGEIADYNAIVDMADAPTELKAMALFNRGIIKGQRGDTDGAIADYGAVVDMADAPAEQKATALVNRGGSKYKRGDTNGAIVDYDTVVDMDDAPVKQKTTALVNRGIIKRMRGDTDDAITDYNTVVYMTDAPAEQKARALVNRGAVKDQRGDTDNAITDYNAVVDMAEAPAELKAMALINRGVAKGKRGDNDSAITDCNAVVDMADTPTEFTAKALVMRGAAKSLRGDTDDAITDFNTVVDMTDAPTEQKAMALVILGAAKSERGDTDDAITDYNAVVDMTDAPDEQKAKACFNLGCIYARSGMVDETLKAFRRWKELDSQATRHRLDGDSDFDPIRHDKDFLAFRETLPE